MSWFEIEAKTKIKDLKAIKKSLKKFAIYHKKEIKIDSYYTLENYKKAYPKKSLRIRKKGNNRIVNFKHWIDYKNGIHIKKEIEFTTANFKKFLSLLKEFGFKKWITKTKECYIYKYRKSTIELNKVKNLGWFIEIEYLCSKNEIPKAIREIKSISKKLNLKNFEEKGYTKQLYEKRKN